MIAIDTNLLVYAYRATKKGQVETASLQRSQRGADALTGRGEAQQPMRVSMMTGLRVFIMLAAIVYAEPVRACDCGILPTCDALWTADLVFTGVASRVAEVAPRKEEAQFDVEEWFRGERVGRSVTIVSEGIGFSCDYDFTQGARYTVFASRQRDGSWKALACGGTAQVDAASPIAAYIRRAVAPGGTGLVSGSLNWDTEPGEIVRLGTPIVGARVHLRSSEYRLTATTDEKGAFQLEVPAGHYVLLTDVPKNAAPLPPRRIAVGRDACIRQILWTVPR